MARPDPMNVPVCDTTTKTAATNELIFDKAGNVYFADLVNNKIQSRKPDGSIHTLVEGDKVRWADTFSISDNHLLFTNSRVIEAADEFEKMIFSLHKIQ